MVRNMAVNILLQQEERNTQMATNEVKYSKCTKLVIEDNGIKYTINEKN